MPLTNDFLSVWELAHRLAGSDPYKQYWFGLPHPVKDNVRLLFSEVLDYRLTSSLIIDKRPEVSDIPDEYFIRPHLDLIYSCIEGKSFPKRLLKFVQIDLLDFHDWCERTDRDPPAFWPLTRYLSDEGLSEQSDPRPPKSSGSRNQGIRAKCRQRASAIWDENPALRIAQVAREIQSEGIGDHFTEKTVVNWIRSTAPASVRNQPGRPRK
jgi:hypothetical protein